MILAPILLKIAFWKKKLPNLPKNTENPRFFEFQKIIKCPKSADKHIKSSGLLEILTRIFLLAQNQKFMKLFKKWYPPQRALFWGGEGKIIKCRFAQKSPNMRICLPWGGLWLEKGLSFFLFGSLQYFNIKKKRPKIKDCCLSSLLVVSVQTLESCSRDWSL